MKIKIACLKNACLERKFKTGDKFWLGRRGFGRLGLRRGRWGLGGRRGGKKRSAAGLIFEKVWMVAADF